MSLELHDVYKTFRDNGPETPALAGVSFDVPTGDFAVLIGPSGSGKSTICNLITGLIRPDRGHVVVDGAVIDGVPGQVGYMPQRDLLLPWRTVLENVVLGPEIAGRSRAEALDRAREMLPIFGLERFANAYPAALSGGMRQRAALLRTFLLQRQTLVLDEPFGALDALTRRELQDWLLDVWARFRPTILFITHDVREAVLLADRVIVLTARPGRVHLQQTIALPRPRDDSSEAFTRTQIDLLRTLESLPRSV
ncbi:MAG: ABC transporter ATP-binding protein [Anaerolineae bacterium]|nr:ABC transporter ATP-binding protein [Anaerolineae bacterium]